MKNLVILLCALLWCGVATASETTKQTLSAKQLVAEYESNELAADMKYKGKEITIDGEIVDISTDDEGTPLVFVGTKYITDSVDCRFPKSAINQLSKLHKGQWITIKGTVLGFSIVPHLKNSSIVSP